MKIQLTRYLYILLLWAAMGLAHAQTPVLLDKNGSYSLSQGVSALHDESGGLTLQDNATLYNTSSITLNYANLSLSNNTDLFINNKLALDLGGMHNPAEGTIDFDAQADRKSVV